MTETLSGSWISNMATKVVRRYMRPLWEFYNNNKQDYFYENQYGYILHVMFKINTFEYIYNINSITICFTGLFYVKGGNRMN